MAGDNDRRVRPFGYSSALNFRCRIARMSSVRRAVIVLVSFQQQSSFQAVPLGAACIVSALKAHPAVAAAASVSLVDFSLEDTPFAGISPAAAGEAAALRIASGEPSDVCRAAGTVIIGFSVYVWNRLVAESCALKLKTLLPGCVVFAGGPEVTSAPSSWTSASGIDYLLSGEGEQSAVDLTVSILESDTRTVAGAASDRPQNSPHIPSAPAPVLLQTLPPDLSKLPSPWLDGTLVNLPSVREHRGALWELARGCPYKCSYCYESRGTKKVRHFPAERLEKELETFASSGIERVFILDPTYNANRDRALTLLSLIERKGSALHFNFEVRAEHLDRELAAAFSRIPCSLQIGLQSANPDVLKAVNRPTDLSLFKKKIGLLNDAGVIFGFDLMYGLPGDSLRSFRSSLDYAIALYPNNLEIFRLAVLPGTELFDRAADFGLVFDSKPPYLVASTPTCPAQDLDRAEILARACDIFYTQGRAVAWFLAALHPLKLKPSQFFQDFASFLSGKKVSEQSDQRTCEKLQLEFIRIKFREKQKAFLLPAVCDTIALNGAWTRALAEGEETRLSLSYHPEDLFSPDAMDLEYFTENACMEHCEVRVFPGAEGPDLEIM